MPGSGRELGREREPLSIALPNAEFERTPASLCRPASPRSIKMNLHQPHMALWSTLERHTCNGHHTQQGEPLNVYPCS